MTIPGFTTELRQTIHLIIEMCWRAFAAVLDMLVTITPMQAAMLFVGVVVFFSTGMLRMQKHLNSTLSEDADDDINPLALEAKYSLPGYLFRGTRFLAMLPAHIVAKIAEAFSSDDDEDDEEEEEPPPVLVPSLGPSLLWAALITAGLAVLGLVADPLIRWRLDLPAHFPTWQYLLFGHRPELGPYLPLETHPYLGAVVVGTFWVFVWSTIARFVRLWHYDDMGTNLIDQIDDQSVLSSWRTHFGVTDLAGRNESFDTWAKWLPLVALPLLGVAFFSLGGDPYRVGLTAFAVAAVAWVSWSLHLRMEGVHRPEKPPEKPDSEEPSEAVAAGWEEVLADLRRVHGVEPPDPAQPVRDVEPLAFSEHDVADDRLISPLLVELLPEPKRLTAMQHDVLTSLSRQSYVHLDPPGDIRSLELGEHAGVDESMMRHRNQIVIASEGAGKTTLGVLAAFNTALIHADGSLVVVRDDATADRLVERMRTTVRPSTLRWNLRVRRVGGDMVEDLAAGIIPDVLVCTVDDLVTTLLDDVETYRPVLENLGLVVVDDLETICGPVEVHTQLAFRRLELRLRQLRDVDEIGEEQAPIFLLLASETMDALPAWARSLCGIDAVPRRFESQSSTQRRERARRARSLVDSGGSTDKKGRHREDDVYTGEGRKRRQVVYDLDDFTTGGDEPLSILELVEACEALAVPWHFRPAGDDRRLLGRSVLPLRNEPQSHVDDPLDAAVVVVEGHATAVQREIDRLGRAGARFSSRFTPERDVDEGDREDRDEESLPDDAEPEEVEPIALVKVVDSDERTALAGIDGGSALGDLVASLPRPFLRPPSGYLTRRHLTGELVQHWTEIADLLEVFGNEIASLLRDLVAEKAVLAEERTELESGQSDYEQHVWLRGLKTELLGDDADDEGALLPPPVENVEVASRDHVAVRERSTLVELMRVDAESARHRFYPGRIFETSRGRHVVVEYADEQSADAEGYEVGDIVAEPFLGTEVTSPRRRVRIDLIVEGGESLAPEPVYFGRAPVGVGLYAVRCRVEHRATFRLHRRTGEIHQRIYRPETERTEAVLRTVALGIHPNIEPEESGAAELTLGAARLIAAALRAIVPLLYRGADKAIGVGLHVEDGGVDNGVVLASTDGVFIYDLHGGANGACRAIERDGVDALLKLSRHLLVELEDHRRLVAMYDEWDAPLDDDGRAEALDAAVRWFESRLGSGDATPTAGGGHGAGEDDR